MTSRVISHLLSSDAFTTMNSRLMDDLAEPENRQSVEFEEEKGFDAIRVECQSKRVLFEDPRFPAVDTSLYFSTTPPYAIEWMRPPDIALKHGLVAEMFVGGSDSGKFAIKQGELGCSSVVAALAVMSENSSLLKHIIPRGQSFQGHWYAGVFCFRFWRNDSWQEVVIDDRLPTVKGELVFVHSSYRRNEFWPALLEKAYAKLMGSYESLRSCTAVDALHDFTGGLVESFCLEREPPQASFLINSILKALERQSIVGCCINIQDIDGQPAATLSNGLVTGQQYNVTDLRELKLISDNNEVPMAFVRIRNPWGKKHEWKGPWNEKSLEWNSISSTDRKAMGLLLRDDAEFWMELKDFMSNFDVVEICNLIPDESNDIGGKWVRHSFNGKWKQGFTGGGRPACRDTHWLNPQYIMKLNHSDIDSNDVCTVIIQLEQKCTQVARYKLQNFVDIGFVIYKFQNMKESNTPLSNDFFQNQTFIARCDYFSNSRLQCKRFVLEPGTYVIVPSTYEPDVEASFVLQVLTEKDNDVEYVDVVGVPENFGTLAGENLRDKDGMFQKFFEKFAGEDMCIDVFQFRQLLLTALKKDNVNSEIGLPVCKSLLLLVDKEHCGKMKLVEFLYLWNMIKCWRKTFATFDKSNQGTVHAYELRPLVATLGYRLSSPISSRLIFLYANEQYLVDLESFISCMAQILNVYEMFKKHEKNGKIVCDLEEWLEVTLNA